MVDRTQGRRLSPEEISRSFTRCKKKEKKKEKKGKGQVRGDATLGRGRAGKEKATKASLWSAEGEGEFTKVNEPARIKRRKGKEEESA